MNTIVNKKPPRIAMALIATAAILQFLAPFVAQFVARVRPEIDSVLPFVAAFLAASGFSVMIVAWWQFRRHDVAICPTAPTRALLTDGIYRLTRNPMYLGIFLMMLGLAVFVGSLPYFLAAVVFIAIMDRHFCPYEEAKLEDAFGDGFTAYRRSTRRWI